MAIELGALEVVFRAVGATGILNTFKAIDTAGAKSATGIDAISRRVSILSAQLQNAGTRATALARLQAAEQQLTRTIQFGNTSFTQRIRLERELIRVRRALAGRAVGTPGGGILAGLGTAAALTGVVLGYNRITQATDELRNSQEKLRATARITGTALDDLVATAGVGQREFNLSASQANNLSIEMAKLAAKAGDIRQATPALRAFLDLGAARGLDAEATLLAVRQAILGIDEGTDKLFNANPSVLYKRYADAIGVSVGKLTDQQKAQALLNAALEDGGRVRGQFQQWLQTTAGLSAQQATEVTKTAEAFGKAIDPLRRFFLELGTGVATFLGNHATFVTALLAVAGGITAVVFAARGLMAINWARLWALMLVNPAVTAALLALGGIVFLITKRWIEARQAVEDYRAAVQNLSQEARDEALVDLAAQLAQKEIELKAVERKLASPDNSFMGGTRAQDVKKQKALKDEINLLRQKIDILRAIPRSEGGTGTDAPPSGDARGDRIKAMGDEVEILTGLQALRALERADIARALEIERQLTAELAAGNLTREQRLEIEQKLKALREAGLTSQIPEPADFRPGRGQARPDLTTQPVEGFDLPEFELDAMGERLKAKMEEIDGLMMDASVGIGTTIASGLGMGLAAALSGKNPLEALGSTLLSGFGAIMQQLGSALIEYGIIMTGLLPFLKNIFTSGPAAIAAGIALTALGAAFATAFTSGGRGGRSSGGSGFAFAGGGGIPAGSAGFTRDERANGIQRTLPSSAGPAPDARPVNVFAPTIIGPNDPRAQRALREIWDNANARGIGGRR